MNERTGVITFQGNGLTLVGNEVKVGDKAPEFSMLKNDLSPMTLADFAGKVVILVAVPSLDTPVCDIESRRFNDEAAKLGDGAQVVVASMDLPFAQKRWADAAGAGHILTLSDHMTAEFGQAYGLLIKELRLLTRAVLVIDKSGAATYVQYVPEITDEPDYDAALQAAKAAL